MTEGVISRCIVADRIAWTHEMLTEIRPSPLFPRVVFRGQKKRLDGGIVPAPGAGSPSGSRAPYPGQGLCRRDERIQGNRPSIGRKGRP